MRVSELIKQHNDFFNFLDKDIIPRLEGFARDHDIQIANYNSNNAGRISISLCRAGDNSDGILVLSGKDKNSDIDSKIDSEIWGNSKEGQNCRVKFNHDSIKGTFLQFIIQQLYSDKTPGKRGKKKSNTFTMKGLIAHLREFRRRPEFPQILLQKDIKESNLTEECKQSIEITPKANTQGTTIKAELDSIKNFSQTITNAIQEVGTVSPGNGLILGQILHYDEFNELIDSTFGKALKRFGDKLIFEEVYTGRIVSSAEFKITDDVGNKITVSYQKSAKTAIERWSFTCTYNDNKGFKRSYKEGTFQGKVLKVIAYKTYDSIYLDKNTNKYISTGIEDCKPFDKEIFLAKLKMLSSDRKFLEKFYNYHESKAIGIDVDFPFECEFATTFNPTENLTQATNSSAAATIALGLTTTLTTPLLSIINNTIPAISDQNSTNTSSISTNDSSEQGDHTDIGGKIVTIAGCAFFAVMSACITAAICGYYKKCYRAGTYHAGEEGEPQEKADDHTHNNKRSLATIKEEGELLLQDYEQLSPDIEVSGNKLKSRQQALNGQAVISEKIEESNESTNEQLTLELKNKMKSLKEQCAELGKIANTSTNSTKIELNLAMTKLESAVTELNAVKKNEDPSYEITNATATNATSTYQLNVA